MTYFIAKYPAVQAKLQEELDAALGDCVVPNFEDVKNLPYLDAVIHEGLRLFATLGIGLPRVVQAEGLTVLGKTFPPGTIVSVPTYTTHREKRVWGEDAEEYNPDRWLSADASKYQKAFNAFSVGPRQVLSQND